MHKNIKEKRSHNISKLRLFIGLELVASVLIGIIVWMVSSNSFLGITVVLVMMISPVQRWLDKTELAQMYNRLKKG